MTRAAAPRRPLLARWSTRSQLTVESARGSTAHQRRLRPGRAGRGRRQRGCWVAALASAWLGWAVLRQCHRVPAKALASWLVA
jgi:hypothetical protein